MVSQQATTAAWIVDGMTRLAPLRRGVDHAGAVDTVCLLMDPAVFARLTRVGQWSVERYRRWVAGAVARLLMSGPGPARQAGDER